MLLESMACGTPVVATRVADNAHIVGETGCGFLVPVDDAAAAAEAVRILLEETEARTSRSAAARQRASEFPLKRSRSKPRGDLLRRSRASLTTGGQAARHISS